MKKLDGKLAVNGRLRRPAPVGVRRRLKIFFTADPRRHSQTVLFRKIKERLRGRPLLLHIWWWNRLRWFKWFRWFGWLRWFTGHGSQYRVQGSGFRVHEK